MKLLPCLNKHQVMKAYVEVEVYLLDSKWRTGSASCPCHFIAGRNTHHVEKAVLSHRAILVALENRNSLSLPRIQPRFLDLSTHTVVIIMNELHLLTQLLLIFILTMSIFKFDRYSIKGNRSN